MPLFGKPPPPGPQIVERIEPVEIPVLTDVKLLLQRGEYDPALRLACTRVVEDAQRAYGVTFPPGWTLGEILDRGATPSMGPLPEFFARLVELYTPLRYGATGGRRDPDGLLSLLQSIYAQRPMWRLYLEPRNAPGPADATPAAAPGPTAPTTRTGSVIG